MKIEALLTALFLQLAQVGVKREPERIATPPGSWTCECQCYCLPIPGGLDPISLIAGSATGLVVGLIFWRVFGGRGLATTQPSPRRRGHGVLEHPTRAELGRLLQ